MLTYKIQGFDSIGSTNDEAKRLAVGGEPEGTVIAAEAQTAGRGRSGRQWLTPRGAAIALSVILRPKIEARHVTQLSLLGGLAALEGIRQVTTLPAQLKWPNDVLVRGKKVAGVLAEAGFTGNVLEYVVLGIGVNVNGGPPPDLKLDYEATSLADQYGAALDRESILQSILHWLRQYYSQLGTPELAQHWSDHLALRGQRVQVLGLAETVAGRMLGVKADGALLIQLDNGATRTILAGDVHLRSVE
jgi:BirA family biotin operon repressor/biotin-[acetyl-CoA-carboxylase] ligase